MTAEQVARFHAVRGDLRHERLESSEIVADGQASRMRQQIVSDYREAERFGVELDSDRLFRIIDALIGLDRIEEALVYERRLPEADSDPRQRILRRLVERNLRQPEVDWEATTVLVERLLADPALPPETRAWAEARRAEIRLARGETTDAIDGLIIAMQRLRNEGLGATPGLELLLGRAYLGIGETARARRHFERARVDLPVHDPRRAEAAWGLGEIALLEHDEPTALERFDELIRRHGEHRLVGLGRLRRAETLARLGRHEEALEDVTLLVEGLREDTGASDSVAGPNAGPRPGLPGRLGRDEIATQLLAWQDRLYAGGRYETALDYLRPVLRLYDGDREAMPADVLQRLAETRARLAETVRERIESAEASHEGSGATSAVDRAERRDRWRDLAREHDTAAADAWLRHARRWRSTRPEAAADSLWKAAGALDRTGALERFATTLEAFLDLVEDPRLRLRAEHRLGLARERLGNHEGAIEVLEPIVNHERFRFSPEAYASYVPLAKAWLASGRPERGARAEALLREVLEGEARLEPDAPEYLDALVTLGRLHLDHDRHELRGDPVEHGVRAVERFVEALDRAGPDEARHRLHHWLAHAHRRTAEAIAEVDPRQRGLEDPDDLDEAVRDHLVSARASYERSLETNEDLSPETRTALDDEQLRAAVLWRADCSWALGEYERAIDDYLEFADRYPGDRSALVALIQVVNCHAALGNVDAARTAQNRAREVLARMSDQAFAEGLPPRERAVWERWLAWDFAYEPSEVAAASTASAADGPAAGPGAGTGR